MPGTETRPPTGDTPINSEFDSIEVVNRHENDILEAKEYPLAELYFRNGTRAVFSYDETSNDFGLLQQGLTGEGGPLIQTEIDTFLDLYLSLTPGDLAVPEELFRAASRHKGVAAKIGSRAISPSCVHASQLEPPLVANTGARAQTCFSTFYPWFDWHDAATPGLAPTCYYASSFGGKHRYSESYIANCVPAGSPSWLWARHRIYYKNAFGNYVKHYESKVPPGHWEAKTKGSVKRWRRVCYDDGWNSLPTNTSLKYTREGRFSD